jgi:hypothetical protein
LQDIYNLTADSYYQIGAGASCNETCSSGSSTITLDANCVDISDLATNGYMPSVPFDPNASGASLDHTKYFLQKKTNGAVSIGACGAEQGSAAAVPTIIVTR